jgi:SAM-dependent methyltransferase
MLMNFLCPSCGLNLHSENSFFRCAACQIDFPIRREIPLFNKEAARFLDLNKESQLNPASNMGINIASGQNVKMVFDKLSSDEARAKYALMFYVEMQAGWKYLTDLSHPDNALVIGCGTGISSLNLCRSFRNVFVMDTELHNLELVQRRLMENSIKNIKVISGGDTKYLPFPTGFFDLICVNGVFEQVPLMVKDLRVNNKVELRRDLKTGAEPWSASAHLNVQVNYLNEINRMLKTNGNLYLATDNRFNYRHFIKTPDNNANLTSSALVLRLFENLFSLLTGGGRYRYYSRSYTTLRKILKRCNFEQFDFYSLKPDHRLFQEILFFDNKNSQQIDPGYIKDSIKNKLFKSKYVCPSFGIVARKKGKTDNFVQNILSLVASEFGGKYELNRYHTMMKGNVVLDLVTKNDLKRGFIVKIAIDDIAESQNRKNYDMLSILHNDSTISEKIKVLIPRPCGKHVIEGQTIYLEDKMRGEQVSRVGNNVAIRDRILLNALDFIVSLHKATITRATWGQADYMRCIGNVIERVRCIGENVQGAFSKIDTMLQSSFIDSGLSLALKHGDFSIANILIDPNDYAIRGIIDWDNAEQQRPILIDLINLIESSHNIFQDMELGRTVTDILMKNNLSDTEKALVRKYGSVFGSTEHLLVPYTLLYWLYHFDSQIKYNYLIHNPKWMRDNYYNVLLEIDKLL